MNCYIRLRNNRFPYGGVSQNDYQPHTPDQIQSQNRMNPGGLRQVWKMVCHNCFRRFCLQNPSNGGWMIRMRNCGLHDALHCSGLLMNGLLMIGHCCCGRLMTGLLLNVP